MTLPPSSSANSIIQRRNILSICLTDIIVDERIPNRPSQMLNSSSARSIIRKNNIQRRNLLSICLPVIIVREIQILNFSPNKVIFFSFCFAIHCRRDISTKVCELKYLHEYFQQNIPYPNISSQGFANRNISKNISNEIYPTKISPNNISLL